MIRPLEKEGIDRFEVRRQHRTVESITKQEASYFYDASGDDIVYEGDRTAALEVVTLSFEDRYKWRFSDGQSLFTADVEDSDFFDRVSKREISFGKGDVLEVILHTKTWREHGELKTENKVVKVNRVIPASRAPIPLIPVPRKRK
jgi:hypothetical protein